MTTHATEPSDVMNAGNEQTVELQGLLAEFDDPGALLHAAEKVRDAGHRNWDCHTPFPVHGLDGAMGIKMTKLPVFIFFCGLAGCILGVVLQWYTNASDLRLYLPVEVSGYPYDISGKPTWSLPANIPVIFELTILLSAFGAVFGMFGFNRLPKLYNPLFVSRRFDRVTQDKFFIYIEKRDPKFDEKGTESLLRDAGANVIERIED